MSTIPLTAAQTRYLTEIRRDGVRIYNGRARRSIKALEAAGLVSVEWDARAQAKGGGVELVEMIIVHPVEP